MRSLLLPAACLSAALAAVTSVLAACGAAEGPGPSGAEAPGDAGAAAVVCANGAAYVLRAGETRFATLVLRLRERPDTNAPILRQMPGETRVTVLDDTCPGEWVRVEDDRGNVGFTAVAYLAPEGGVPALPVSAARGKALAEAAVRLHEGKTAVPGRDLAAVRESVLASGIVPTPPGWMPGTPHAFELGRYANANPAMMAERGFRRVDGLGTERLPQGALLIWQPGQCGFPPDGGHIEIVVDTASSRACGDACAPIRRGCGEPWTWVPTER